MKAALASYQDRTTDQILDQSAAVEAHESNPALDFMPDQHKIVSPKPGLSLLIETDEMDKNEENDGTPSKGGRQHSENVE